MKTFLLLLFAFTMLEAQTEMKDQIEMPAIFSDNMVLQQKTMAPVWGKAVEGTNVKVTGSWGENAQAITDNDGKWMTKIKTPGAGGPYELKIEIGNSTIVYKNVLIGEVWLCSGQSNMEMPMEGWPPQSPILGGPEAIKEADYPNLRLFTVMRAYSTEPQFECAGKWSECSPKTAATFSATAFYFGRKLSKELNIPIGLIHSSWGGTRVEAWISGKELKKFDKYKETFEKMKNSSKEIAALNAWLTNHPVIDVTGKDEDTKWKDLDFGDRECSAITYNDSDWHEMTLPKLWEGTEVGDFDGVVWFRKKIEIPDAWMNKNLVLELGAIDDMDISFVNGTKVGSYETTGFYATDRVYNIPANLVNTKSLTIAVRVVDNQGGGGIWGDPAKMKIHPKDSNEMISLAGSWKYLPVADYYAGKFYVFGLSNEFYNRPKVEIAIGANTLSALYNGMISPLVPYSIKGAIWYQGEANVGNPEEYKTLFPLMIKNWRTDWNEKDFPFYFVQIAPYNYGTDSKSERLREAQLQSLSVPNTGMAVTMDIGNPDNIHPGDKQDVGERLARWALAKDYGKNVVVSGPLYKSMKVIQGTPYGEDGKIILSFDYADGLVVKPRDGKNNFQIAGNDKVFFDADVKVQGNTLVVSSPNVKQPAAVRYCWDNIEKGTLFNKEGLPSPSFRTDNWEE